MLTICVPCQDSVSAIFAKCLANLTAELARTGIKHYLYFLNGTVLPDSRNKLVIDSLKNNSEYILWLDSDMVFPSDVFLKLSKHNKDIVAATYSTRVNPPQSVAFVDEFDLSKRLNHTTGLHSVYAVGMGCMLVKTSVFKKIKQPWFNISWDNDTESFMGEDIYFCNLAYNSGYEIFVDCDLSKEVGHHGSKIYMLEK